ncbi:MAG: hypothetical protein JNL67_21225, partial [Planctomycetaceae bacterium]|nr:hypothetical protein [Planctomycetaceae bacterium]
ERQDASSQNNWTITYVPIETPSGGIAQTITHTKPAADNTITIPNQGTNTTVAPGGENHTGTSTLSTHLTVQKPLADFMGAIATSAGYESPSDNSAGASSGSSEDSSQTSGSGGNSGNGTDNTESTRVEYDGIGPSMIWQYVTQGTVFEGTVNVLSNLDVIRYVSGRWRTYFNQMANDGVFTATASASNGMLKNLGGFGFVYRPWSRYFINIANNGVIDATQAAANDLFTNDSGGIGIAYRGLVQFGQNLARGESIPVAYWQAAMNEAFVIRNFTAIYEWYTGKEYSGSSHGEDLTSTQEASKLLFGGIGLVGDALVVFSVFRAIAPASQPLNAAQNSTLSRGAQLRQRFGSTFDEYARFRSQGYSPAAAKRLTQPYTGAGQHFIQQAPINRAVARFGENSVRGRLLTWYRDSAINVVSGHNMNTGRFYEYHARIHGLPAYGRRTAQGMRMLPGEPWVASRVSPALEPYGRLGYLWHGSPTAFKVFAGGIVITTCAGIWGVYEYFDD